MSIVDRINVKLEAFKDSGLNASDLVDLIFYAYDEGMKDGINLNKLGDYGCRNDN